MVSNSDGVKKMPVNLISNVNVPDHSLTHIADSISSGSTWLIYADNTAANGSDVTGNWVDFNTYAITDANADYPKILFTSQAGITCIIGGGGTGTGYQRIYSDASSAQVGEYMTQTVSGATLQIEYQQLTAILTAGVDYTQGTAFNIKTQGRTTRDNTQIGVWYSKSVQIWGVC